MPSFSGDVDEMPQEFNPCAYQLACVKISFIAHHLCLESQNLLMITR